MPKEKITKKKPIPNKVFFPCQYCNKGLKSIQGKVIHEKNCPLNTTNKKEPEKEINEIAKIIPKETIKKMENNLDPLGNQALESLEKKKQEISSGKKPLSPEEKQKMQVVLDFVQDQKDKQLMIEEKRTQIDSIKQDSNLLRAQKELKDLQGSGGEIFDEKFQQFIFKLKAMEIALGNKSNNQSDNSMTSQLMQENRDIRKQNFDLILTQMKEAKSENDLEKFTKTFEMLKGMQSVIGEKSGGTEIITEIAKQLIPPVVNLGKQVMDKRQQDQLNFPTPQNPAVSPGTVSPETTPEISPGENSPNINMPEGELGSDTIPPQPAELTDQQIEKLSQNMDLSDFGIDSSFDKTSIIDQSLGMGIFSKNKNPSPQTATP